MPHVEVVYGTTRLKLKERAGDFFLTEADDLRAAGLRRPTRFDPKRSLWLPWAREWFAPPTAAHATPLIGRLTDTSIAELRRIADAL